MLGPLGKHAAMTGQIPPDPAPAGGLPLDATVGDQPVAQPGPAEPGPAVAAPPGRLDQTLPDAATSALAPTVTVSTGTPGGSRARGDSPAAPEVSEAALSGPGPRFTLAAPLGRGATSQVWAAHDHDFDREVAIKHLAAAPGAAGMRGRFLHEARLTASLDHPNIVPVYDLGAADDGGLFLVMRRISGLSLGARISAAVASGKPGIAPANAVVTIFLKLCDALAFAHAKGVLHRDIKPDNIMLGDFGEVVMVDWGAASDHSPAAGPAGTVRGMVGTPVYMAPEIARGAPATEAGDVYSLGASLFHALMLRHPLAPTGNAATFWARKRAGAIDAPTPAERKRVPLHLLAITLKAMAAEPAARYPTVAAFADDLGRWQAGLAVTAVKDIWAVRLARWHRRRARVLYPALAALALVAGVGFYAYGQRLQEIASWGRPVIAEDFADDAWITRWTPTKPGAFAVTRGALVSRGERESFLLCNRRFSGSVAIEFDGEILPGSQPCDLSVVWTDCDAFATSPPRLETGHSRMAFLQAGADDNLRAMIMTEPYEVRQSASRMRLETGRSYHIRAVIDGTHLELLIDGRSVCAYDDVFPYTSGYIALYGYYPGKSFSHIRIYDKGVAQKVPALAIGDAFYQEGSYAAAAAAYQHLIDSLPGTAQADPARLRLGLSWMVQGRWDLAQSAWRLVQDPLLRQQIRVHGLDHAVQVGDFAALKPDFLELYADQPELRAQLKSRWIDWVGQGGHAHYSTLAPLVDIEQQAFPDDPDTNELAEVALDRLGRWPEAVAQFAHDDLALAPALLGAGRFQELLERFPDNRILHYMARFNAGGFAAVAAGPGSEVENEARQYTWAERDLLLCAGRWDDYRTRFGMEGRLRLMTGDDGPMRADEVRERIIMLVQHGHPDDALAAARAAAPTIGVGFTVALLVQLGRSREALPILVELGDEHTVRTGIALDALINGDARAAREQARLLGALPWSVSWRTIWFERMIALPFINHAVGDDATGDGIARSLAEWAGRRDQCEERSWWIAHKVLGDVSDEDFLHQPYRAGAEGMLVLAHAIAADRTGDGAAAVAAYRDFLALPAWQRGIEGVGYMGDPTMARFAVWRVAVLDTGAGKPAGSATLAQPGP